MVPVEIHAKSAVFCILRPINDPRTKILFEIWKAEVLRIPKHFLLFSLGQKLTEIWPSIIFSSNLFLAHWPLWKNFVVKFCCGDNISVFFLPIQKKKKKLTNFHKRNGFHVIYSGLSRNKLESEKRLKHFQKPSYCSNEIFSMTFVKPRGGEGEGLQTPICQSYAKKNPKMVPKMAIWGKFTKCYPKWCL